MSDSAKHCIVFQADDLLPDAWKTFAAAGPIRMFNPGLLPDGSGWIFAYRVVAADGARRIAICRLNAELRVVKGSPCPLTDHVRFRPDGAYPEIVTSWFADPRLYRFGGRVFIYWNSGWHEPRNWQFVQELDPTTLLPWGHPRELLLQGERQKLEKNWTFFSEPEGGRLLVLYSISPHRILTFSLDGDGDVIFHEIASIDWSIKGYPSQHGGLRGGAPPCFSQDRFWVFCHSVHDDPNGYRYAPAVYSFAGRPPFAPLTKPTKPLPLANPFGPDRMHARLNPAVGEVIYPCGAAFDGAQWLVSYGINDERCAIAIVTPAEVNACLGPVHS